MKYVVHNLRLDLSQEKKELLKRTAKKLNIKEKDILSFRMVKESIDARKKNKISFVYSVCVEVVGKIKRFDSDIKGLEEKKEAENWAYGDKKIVHRPVIIGMGPCGLFAGLILAQNGYKPLLIERGEDVYNRNLRVQDFWDKGHLSKESNVQFGEGGAGTFSDGKLTTRINDKACEQVLQILYESGAPEDILYKAKPHIGSDKLPKVVENIREKIKALGGEVWFNTKLEDIGLQDGKVREITLRKATKTQESLKSYTSIKIDTNLVILAIGHSSRDTFEMLEKKGLAMEAKAFSIGLRIEHPQELINKAQYGDSHKNPKLFAADYALFQRIGSRTAYSFCMCPGGLVVASASEENTVVTNGMSERNRDRENANSAFVVSVEPGDFGGKGPLAGIEFQRKYEKLAFSLGGGGYGAPIQTLGDFLKGQKSQRIGEIQPSFTGRTTLTDLNLCMPQFVGDTLKAAVGSFEGKLKGFGREDALLTGMETRTSSPLRILRGDNFQAFQIEGLFPAGEGAGYAGGITSAAVDGIKVAKALMTQYNPKI